MRRSLLVLGATLVAITAFASTGRAQVGTEFTYQGKLENMGAVVTSPTDMQFSLWTANSGGSQVGSTLTSLAVPVTTGLFTVSLDFGVAPYTNNQALYLQIDVRNPAGSGSYVPMTSRQKLTATPFSLATRGINVDAAGTAQVVGLKMPTGATAGYVLTSDASGTGTWQVAPGAGSSGGWTDDGAVVRLSTISDKVGIGTATPGNKLAVNGPVDVFGTGLDGASLQKLTIFADANNGVLFEAPLLASKMPYHFNWRGGGPDALTIVGDGNVGIGASVPTHKLDVNWGNNANSATFGDVEGAGPLLYLSTTPASGTVNIQSRNAHDLTFMSFPGGVQTELMRVRGGGGGFPGVEVKGDLSVGIGAPHFTNVALSVKSANYGIRSEATGVEPAGQFHGDLTVTGVKSFLQPHPTDASKAIDFVCLEGNEAGTYFRGSATLSGGAATIVVPEDFRLATEAEGLTVQVTPVGRRSTLWIESESLDRIEVRGDSDVKFHYTVNGVRRGYRGLKTIVENEAYRPRERGVPYGTQYPKEIRDILVGNGILNPDYTPNEGTAARMGWKLENAPERK